MNRAIVLVAGRGNRLRPLTDDIPKALIEVGGKPISALVVDQLIDCGITHITFVVGYRGEAVRLYFDAHRPAHAMFDYVQQEQLSGTGGALQLVKPFLGNQPFLVAFGDSYFAPHSVERVVAAKCPAAVAVVSVPDPERYGVVVLDEQGRIVDVEEKPLRPKSNLVIGGVYKFDSSVWKHVDGLELSPRGELELPDVVRSMTNAGEAIQAVQLSYMVDVGTIEELRRLNETVANS
jgi:dTDP-glucose pyrophosphorylase